MKIRLKPLAAAVILAGLASSTYAVSPQENIQIAKLSEQTKLLLAQVNSLQKEVKHLKYQQVAQVGSNSSTKRTTSNTTTQANKTSNNTNNVVIDPEQQTMPDEQTIPVSSRLSGKQLRKLIAEEREYLPFDLDVPGQAFVSTGPYVGVPIQFAGSDLVINSPSVNTDLQLLGIRKAIYQQLQAMGGQIYQEPFHSHLLLSGVVQGQAGYLNRAGSPNTSFIDVSNVSFDAFFMGPSPWILGFIEFSYDGSSPANSVFYSTNNYTVSNSRVFVNKAFVTLGDLSQSPIYGTFGQFYVPFGRYSSLLISDPFTKILTRTKARAIQIGMQQQGDDAFYGAVYIFRGDSYPDATSRINNGGVNLGYKFKMENFSGDFGGGLIGNIADSGGMQLGTGFANFESIRHRVPGYNLRGIFSVFKDWDIITEIVGATTDFNPNDMSYNGSGAKPYAFDIELAYSFVILDNKPSAIALAYEKSYQGLALGLPLQRWALVFNTSLLRNTLQSIEFRHDTNYGKSQTANGPTGAQSVIGNTCTSAACNGPGGVDNAVTAQFDYYF